MSAVLEQRNPNYRHGRSVRRVHVLAMIRAGHDLHGSRLAEWFARIARWGEPEPQQLQVEALRLAIEQRFPTPKDWR